MKRVVCVLCFVLALFGCMFAFSTRRASMPSSLYTVGRLQQTPQAFLKTAAFQQDGTTVDVNCSTTPSGTMVLVECCPPSGNQACTTFLVRKPIEELCPGGPSPLICGGIDPPIYIGTFWSDDDGDWVFEGGDWWTNGGLLGAVKPPLPSLRQRTKASGAHSARWSQPQTKKGTTQDVRRV